MTIQYEWYLIVHKEFPGTASETAHNMWVKTLNYPLYEDLLEKLGEKVFNFSVVKIYNDLEKLGHLPEHMSQILNEFRTEVVVKDCPDDVRDEVLEIIK